jgi:glycosyltransferase involved in cell wall biosynthesis
MNNNKKKLKVLTIITKLELGGAQEVALYTANNLGEDFESYFISGEKGLLDENKEIKFKNIKQFFNIFELKREINPYFDLLAFFKIIFLIFKINPDIIHSHSSKAGILARIAAFLLRVKVIVHTYHGFGFHDYQNKLKKLFLVLTERFAAKCADILIVVSKLNIDKALNENIGEKKQYKIIRCGIDIEKYENKFESIDKNKILFNNIFEDEELKNDFDLERNDMPDNAKIIGMLACFKPQKSPEDFVEIANKLISESKDKNLYFVMVGDGELRKNIEARIKHYKIGKYFRLLGWRNDIDKILKTFDVMVLTSIFEGLPMSILEGMATGIPIVATKVDGTQEVIIDNHNGFLIECHDINNFVEKIRFVLNNQYIKHKFIENSKKLLTEEFNEKFVIEKIKNLYLELFYNKTK